MNVETADQLIDALGGNKAVSDLVGDVGATAVSNWRARGIPAWAHRRLVAECESRTIRFNPEIFDGRPKRRPADQPEDEA